MCIIKIDNLSVVKYNKNILDNIVCNIPEWKHICIVGHNGSGKTTLIKCMCRLIENDKIIIKDKNIMDYSLRDLARTVAYIPQFVESGYMSQLNVIDYLYSGRYPYSTMLKDYNIEDKNIVFNAMKRLDIEKFKNRKINTLSGGEFQKVLLASTIVQDTNILLLDEAESFLDIEYKLEADSIIRELVSKGKTVISVIHNINDAINNSDYLIALKQGKIIYSGTTERFINTKKYNLLFNVDFEKMEFNNKIYLIPVSN